MPCSASQITPAQRQSYNKNRLLNHISAAFYRPTPQLRRYETVCHTQKRVCVCFTKHLTAFHLRLLLDQPRAAVASPFAVLASHTPSRACTRSSRVTIGSRAPCGRSGWSAGFFIRGHPGPLLHFLPPNSALK